MHSPSLRHWIKDRNEHSPEYKVIAVQDRSIISEDDERLFAQLEAEGMIIVRCDKGETLGERLLEAGIAPDIRIASDNLPESKVHFCHRKTDDTEIYFVYNHSDKDYRHPFYIRTDRKEIEIWYPLTAERILLAGNSLILKPHEAAFIIAR